jgi:hypothetical protein
MTAPKTKIEPWWEKPNAYLGFELRDDFVAGAASIGYRVNSKQEALMGLISAGYMRNSFSIPKSHTGGSNEKTY